ncbi:MAG: hypothetical protein ACRDJV_14985 [Actinomycetota bacterium]
MRGAEKWTELTSEHAAPDYVLWSWCRNYLRRDLLPDERVVVRVEFHGTHQLAFSPAIGRDQGDRAA